MFLAEAGTNRPGVSPATTLRKPGSATPTIVKGCAFTNKGRPMTLGSEPSLVFQ